MSRARVMDPRKLPRQSRSRVTVESILQAAAHVFDTLGYVDTTTNKIAERAGVSIGSLYQYFPNKDSILVALAERHVSEALAETERVAAGLREDEPDLPTIMRFLVESYFAFNAQEQTLSRVIFDEAPRTPELRATLAAFHGRLAAEVAFHAARLRLELRDPDLSSMLVVQTVTALVHEVALRPPAGRSAEECLAEITACGLAYLSQGSAPK